MKYDVMFYVISNIRLPAVGASACPRKASKLLNRLPAEGQIRQTGVAVPVFLLHLAIDSRTGQEEGNLAISSRHR